MRKWNHQGLSWREKLPPETPVAGAWVNTTLIGGSPAGEAPQVVEQGARTGLGNIQRGKSQGDYVGCCSRSSQASRSTYTRHTPMPVSHPLGWKNPYPWSMENGNIQVQDTSHQEALLGNTSFSAVNALHLPLGRLLTPEGQTLHPGGLKGELPGRMTRQLRRAPWQKTSAQDLPLGEESAKQKDHAYSSKYWSHPLAQNVLPSIIQNQADEVKSQNILHFLHPNPVRIPQDWTLEKTLFFLKALLPITIDLTQRYDEYSKLITDKPFSTMCSFSVASCPETEPRTCCLLGWKEGEKHTPSLA